MREKSSRITGSGAGKNKVYVDTSAWIAFFSARDQNHIEAERLIREAVAHGALLITTNLVLAEVHRLILHRAGVAPAAMALDRIGSSLSTSILFASEAHHASALEWLDRFAGHRVTYTDAIGFAVMKDSRCSGFLSFDADFLLPGFSAWSPT